MKQTLFIKLIIIVFSLTLWLGPGSVRAAIWYDKLPPGGETAPRPLIENQPPADFTDGVNVGPEQLDGQSQDESNPADAAVAATSNDTSPVPMRWPVIVGVLLITAALVYWVYRRNPKQP